VFFRNLDENGLDRPEFRDRLNAIDLTPTFPNGAALNNSGQLLGPIPTSNPAEFELKLVQNQNAQFVGMLSSQLRHLSIVGHNTSARFVGLDYQEFFDEVRTFVGTIGQSPIDIGDLGGGWTLGTDINELGQVVGTSHTGASPQQIANCAAVEEAFVYKDGAMFGIGTLGGHASYANALNDVGQIVGESTTSAFESHAFLYDTNNGMRDIGRDGRTSYAFDINNSAQVVGVEIDGAGGMHAFLHDQVSGFRLLENLIAAGSGWSNLREGTSINNAGQIAGTGLYNGQLQAFLLTPVPEPTSLAFVILALLSACIAFRPRSRS
jgi:probable HAF family extracellular repeat protein